MSIVEHGGQPALTPLVITNGVQLARLNEVAAQLPRLSDEAKDDAELHQILMDGVVLDKVVEAAASTTRAVTLSPSDMFIVAAQPVGKMLGLYPGVTSSDDAALAALFARSWTNAGNLL